MFYRRACAVAAVLFFFSALLQLNDPDPLRWMALYGAAGAVAAAAAIRRTGVHWGFPLAIGLVATVWATAIGRHALGRIPLLSMFQSWEMHNALVEENRETIGLLIVAAWMAMMIAARSLKPKR